jgi:hypothetical protein
MRKHRKAKQRQMNNPIMQLLWAIDAAHAMMKNITNRSTND